jgi:hypothetical protein
MKTYNVFLVNFKGQTLLKHSLFAKNENDAKNKCLELVKVCKNLDVYGFYYSLKNNTNLNEN